MSARLATLLLGALVLVLAGPAHADVSLQTTVSARKVEVGQPFQLQLLAMGTGDPQPLDPDLVAPTSVEVRGPSIGTQTQVSLSGGRMQRSVGISATWTLVARRAGTLRVGPASVDVGGRRARGEIVTIEVVPQGSLRRAQPRAVDPFWFDPFGGSSPFPGLQPFGQGNDQPEELPPVPEELRIEQAPDPIAFVRAVVTPKHPVVGEQVTLKIFAYGGRGPFREASPTEPSRADFLGYSVVESSYGEEPVRMRIGDAEFIAVKLRELALFPLHSGKLEIGPLTMTFQGPRYRAATPVIRASERIALDVTEPPLRGRPPGYRLGDVGELQLSARVDPLRVSAGDGVSVVAKLEGTGNIPLSLVVPQKRGVEWLEPSISESIAPDGSTVKGFRVFTYVVKLAEPGQVALGELTLPYFDPKKRAYAVARAELGRVVVDPNPKAPSPPTPTASASASPDLVKANLAPAPRRALEPFARASAPITDDLGFWAFLFGAPFAVTLAGSSLELGKKLRQRFLARRTEPDRLAAVALGEAEAAARSGRLAETAGAVERALFRAIEAGTGLRARALLRNELAAALEGAGIPRPTVEETLSVLSACEARRFTDGTSESSPQALVERARALVGELVRKRKRR